MGSNPIPNTIMKKILVMGLPGTGKTTFSSALAYRLSAVHFNADEIRAYIHKDLGFSIEDRIEHAKRLGVLCDIVNRSGQYSIADFVCPTLSTRDAFGAYDSFVVWCDRTPTRHFSDTSNIFIPPSIYNIRMTDADTIEDVVDKTVSIITRGS